MEKIPAAAGWHWIKQGFALFRKQPAELATLFFCYFFLMLAMSLIPVIGTGLSIVLIPTLSLAFLQAGANIEEDKRVYPHLLLAGFRSPAFGTLVALGILHIAAFAAAIGAASLLDGGLLWKMMSGAIPADPDVLEKSGNPAAMLVLLAVYLPCAMALWFAAPLAAWQGMSTGKSTFYSFFTVWRARAAFLVYILTWSALMAVMEMLLEMLASATGSFVAGVAKMGMLSLMTVAMYCSFYRSYAAIFPKPDAPAQLPAPPEGDGEA